MESTAIAGVVLLAVLLGMGSLAAAAGPWTGPSVDLRHGDLKVSPDGRFLVHADGTPFFYLGDTAWELFHRLDRPKADRYLENRRAKGFTVIQAVVLAEFDGLDVPNAYGDPPLENHDPTRPNEAYFRHVDHVVDRAAEKGIFIGMLPTWGDKWNKKWGKGPEIFTPASAESYGEWLGRRYREKPILWILGGDRPVETDAHRAVIRAMARGLARGDGGRHLMTFHPMGGHTSAEWFHEDAWLAFNMAQSGHGAKDLPNWEIVARDYARRPVKPCLDGEPRYEDHPVNWKSKENGWFDAYDVRQAAYWALLAGACGHTYGCHPVWRMYEPGAEKPLEPDYMRHAWTEVLDLPGACAMTHVRRLMESRPMLERAADQGLIDGGPGAGADHVQAARGKDYAFVYLPTGKDVRIVMGRIAGRNVKASWFDPRTGEWAPAGEFPNEGVRAFDPPGAPARGNDWVLVLDTAAR